MIDLSRFSTSELCQFNKLVVQEVAARRQAETLVAASKFKSGDHVSFSSREGEAIFGFIKRVNKKTLTIDTYSPHGHWRVSPEIVNHAPKTAKTPKDAWSDMFLN